MSQSNATEPKLDNSNRPGDLPKVEPGTRARPKLTFVVVLGPSGSGKSSFINAACNTYIPTALPNTGLCTRSFYTHRCVLGGHELRLVDSPGFNSTLKNQKVFNRFVEYILNIYEEWYAVITGVLYLHPPGPGSDLENDLLKKNIGALRFLLGDYWMDRLTIGIMPQANGARINEDSLRAFQASTSPFHSLCVAGAKVRALTLKPKHIQGVLHDYTKLSPCLPFFQTKFWVGHTGELWDYIGEGFKHGLKTAPLNPAPAHRQATNDRRLPLKGNLDQSAEVIQGLKLTLSESRSEAESLRYQLEQTRTEYASLRSELQLQDNMEQSTIVQSLKDLNREIDNFGRSVAERLVDNYLIDSETEPTTLQASNLPNLKIQFGHHEGVSSLVCASDGTGMLAEDFLDLALRSILCQHLYRDIFLPFHPSLANNPGNEYTLGLYEKVRHRELPNVAAKWRASTFMALSQQGTFGSRVDWINKYVESISRVDMDALFGAFFGEQAGVTLTEQERARLHKIVSSSWDWNELLRGSIIMLGDYQPVAYATGLPFDPLLMAEFEPSKPEKGLPDIAVCTIGFGLTVFRAKVNDKAPDADVICKATVVSERLYN